MRYTIPFTTDSVKKEICGRTMVLGRRRDGSHEVEVERELVLLSVSGDNGVKWDVEDGVLRLLDDRDSPTHEVTAVEVGNNVAFLSGDIFRSTGVRMVMYERAALGTNFRVFVSSHASYEEVAVPRFVRSLFREGVPLDCVTVVVADCEDGSPSNENGYLRVPVKENLMGCTALSYLLREDFDMPTDYALVVHDTCEVAPGFSAAIKAVDVGLPYDLVQGMREISLWSKGFLRRLRETVSLDMSPYEIFKALNDLCRLSRRGVSELMRSRDVYGAGVKRDVVELPELGIRKFVGRDMTGGRP